MDRMIVFLLLFTSAILNADEIINEYPVRWDRGISKEYGRLILQTDSVIFESEGGGIKRFPLLYLDHARLVDERWIKLKTIKESGLSFGLDDTYNFGVVGQRPAQADIDRLNRLIVGARELRIAKAKKLDGEVARYMAYVGETIGDDVGLLIITQDKIIYSSDTSDRYHEWSYSDLSGVELNDNGHLILNTRERAIIKLGLSTRNYRFASAASPFKPEHVSFILRRILEERPEN